MDEAPLTRSTEDRAESHRLFGLVLIGMSAAVWWPAFTLGAWGELFFDQMLTVWVAATAALVVVLVQPASLGRRWPQAAALSIPSVWLLLSFFDDARTDDLATALVDLFGNVIGILGIPFTLWTLVHVLWPELFTRFNRRTRTGVLIAVVLLAVASFTLGMFQDHFLTCGDFTVSGHTQPPGCVRSHGDEAMAHY